MLGGVGRGTDRMIVVDVIIPNQVVDFSGLLRVAICHSVTFEQISGLHT